MKSQMVLEDTFIEIALNNERERREIAAEGKEFRGTVILCDRGVMDGSAYAEPNVWQALLDETAWSTIQLRDRRYEAVIHLVSAADGAEEFYTGQNNEARYENATEAKALDKKLINAWVGHPQF
jgi:hypothetical protein